MVHIRIFISKCHEANIHCINGEWTLWPSQFSNWLDRLYHKVNDVPENKKKFHQIFQSLGCFVNEIWKIENNNKIPIFHSVGCSVQLDQEI